MRLLGKHIRNVKIEINFTTIKFPHLIITEV